MREGEPDSQLGRKDFDADRKAEPFGPGVDKDQTHPPPQPLHERAPSHADPSCIQASLIGSLCSDGRSPRDWSSGINRVSADAPRELEDELNGLRSAGYISSKALRELGLQPGRSQRDVRILRGYAYNIERHDQDAIEHLELPVAIRFALRRTGRITTISELGAFLNREGRWARKGTYNWALRTLVKWEPGVSLRHSAEGLFTILREQITRQAALAQEASAGPSPNPTEPPATAID